MQKETKDPIFQQRSKLLLPLPGKSTLDKSLDLVVVYFLTSQVENLLSWRSGRVHRAQSHREGSDGSGCSHTLLLNSLVDQARMKYDKTGSGYPSRFQWLKRVLSGLSSFEYVCEQTA